MRGVSNKHCLLTFFIAYAFKGQVHVFAGRVKIASHSSCRTSLILKYFCPLNSSKLCIYRVSYMSDRVLLILLNKLWKRDKILDKPCISSLFRNKFDKLNNTRA